MIRICFVCLGNICRSPLAEFLFRDIIEKEGNGDKYFISSKATSNEEEGNGVYYGIRPILDRLNIDYSKKFAEKLVKADYGKYDYFIGMEQSNCVSMLRIFGQDREHKIKRLLDFSPTPKDIDDPWYTRDFEKTFQEIKFGLEYLKKYLNS